MKTIYKYPLAITSRQEVNIPKGAKILCAQIQNGSLFLWALVDEGEALKSQDSRIIDIYGTVQAVFGNPGEYIGTVQQGSLVWHVFEAKA